MDIFGMGSMELILVLFVALIFLGPSKMAETGRYLGKMVRELRKATSDMSRFVLEEEKGEAPKLQNPETSVSYRKQPPDPTEEADENSSKDEDSP